MKLCSVKMLSWCNMATVNSGQPLGLYWQSMRSSLVLHVSSLSLTYLKEHYRIGFSGKKVAGSVNTLCNPPYT